MGRTLLSANCQQQMNQLGGPPNGCSDSRLGCPRQAKPRESRRNCQPNRSRRNREQTCHPDRSRSVSDGVVEGPRVLGEPGIPTNQEERIDDVKECRCVEERAGVAEERVEVAEERPDNVEERRFSAA